MKKFVEVVRGSVLVTAFFAAVGLVVKIGYEYVKWTGTQEYLHQGWMLFFGALAVIFTITMATGYHSLDEDGKEKKKYEEEENDDEPKDD